MRTLPRNHGPLVSVLAASILLLSVAASPGRAQAIRLAPAVRVVQVVGEPAPAVEDDTTDDEIDLDAPRGKDAPPLFYLRDKSKVAGFPKVESLEVKTRYGLLQVPSTELIRVRFVQRVDSSVREQVEALLGKLGDDDFDVRENAMDALRKIGGPALPLLREATESSNEEVQNRAEILVDEIDEAADAAASAVAGDDSVEKLEDTMDEITTTRMTIRGMVEIESFTIDSRYGELAIDVADLEAINFRSAGPTSKNLEIDAKWSPHGKWFDSKVDVEKGQRLRIDAGGNMSVRNYGVTCGPAGTTEWNSGNQFMNFPMLALVGKVGAKGKPFLVRDSYKGRANGSGRLYFSVVPFSYNPGGVTGKYTAKVRIAGAE